MESFSAEDYLDEIWRQGRDYGLQDNEIHRVLTAAAAERQPIVSPSFSGPHISPQKFGSKRDERLLPTLFLSVFKSLCKLVLCLIIFTVSLGAVLSVHNPTRKFVTRNIQDFIFPVMTRLRSVSLPILSIYPTLSSWYSEECLIQNPFFDQVNGNCDACRGITRHEIVSNVQNFSDVYYNNGNIVVITDAIQSVPIRQILSSIDIKKEEDFGTWKTSSTIKDQTSTKEDLINAYLMVKDLHIEWKINRLETLHVVREMFPRLYFIPRDTEVSLHNYMFVDGGERGSYSLPISEFANVLLIQADSSSTYHFEPSSHCKNICQPIEVLVNSSQVLFFNWIFWRPNRIGGNAVSAVILCSFY
ncbi:hypothetical protein SK128_005357 [Halocaridina rubra]|uniref:Uncharacterized protein n=1 Tax=Halocaridina rubra TaxID=373956 RepID=A0AAN8X6P6_HALRR